MPRILPQIVENCHLAGLFDPIEDQPYWHYDVAEAVDTESSQALNHLGSRQGLVLLQNEGNTLPLKEGGKLAVVGPHALAKSALLGNYLGQICPAAYGEYVENSFVLCCLSLYPCRVLNIDYSNIPLLLISVAPAAYRHHLPLCKS